MDLQDRHRVILEVGDLLGPGGGGKGRWITPGVIVESEEVSSLVVSAAIHVVSSFETVVINVCGRVSNRNRAVTTTANVLLHITRYSLDPWGSCTSVDVVDDFVSGEEQKSVIVLLELINGGKDVLQVDMVV